MQAQMIDDMLDMARIVAGKLRLETQPVDLLGVVLGAIDVVMPAAAAKGIAVRTSLDPKTPRVLGDQDRLQQVMWNVLTNGLKFTDPGGSIEVRLETADKAARIVVADSGHGIRADFLPHVFERFRQADTSSGRRHGGLGLGLALVRDLIELHGGSVRALSEGEGKGATFVIELPTVISPEIRRNHVDGPYGDGAAASLQEVRILLVDDESDARELALTALEHCGAEVQAVSSSAEALAVLREMPPDRLPHVIVSDIGMPREDGYDLIRQIRAMDTAHGRIPAVAVTGYATADDMNRAMAAGYQLHIAKPIDPESLIAAISQLVRPQVFVRGDRG
jgi:CheY-like chemotaxis protein